jgi:hypothetical protein
MPSASLNILLHWVLQGVSQEERHDFRPVVQHIRAKMGVNYFLRFLCQHFPEFPCKQADARNLCAPFLIFRIAYRGLYQQKKKRTD